MKDSVEERIEEVLLGNGGWGRTREDSCDDRRVCIFDQDVSEIVVDECKYKFLLKE